MDNELDWLRKRLIIAGVEVYPNMFHIRFYEAYWQWRDAQVGISVVNRNCAAVDIFLTMFHLAVLRQEYIYACKTGLNIDESRNKWKQACIDAGLEDEFFGMWVQAKVDAFADHLKEIR